MNSKNMNTIILVAIGIAIVVGVGVFMFKGKDPHKITEPNIPVYKVAGSQYTSWSSYFAGNELVKDGEELCDGREGYWSGIEKEGGIDLVIPDQSYDACLTEYGNGQADFIMATNMDILTLCGGVDSVALFPTSNSYGGDGLVVTADIKDINDIKFDNGVVVRGLEKSVSEFTFWRIIDNDGRDRKDFRFENLPPEAAAPAMIMKTTGHKAAMLWNPEKLQVLAQLDGSHVPYSSKEIPGEIVDMVIANKKSLSKPKAENAVFALMKIFYTFCELVADKSTQEETLAALGRNCFNKTVPEIKIMVEQSRFFPTPAQGISLFEGGCAFPWEAKVSDISTLFSDAGFKPEGYGVTKITLKEVMSLVYKYFDEFGCLEDKPKVGYGPEEGDLVFDASYMKKYINQ